MVVLLIRHKKVPLGHLTPSRRAQCHSLAVLDALSEPGWDILQVDLSADNPCLIDLVVKHGAPVRRLLECGARVDRSQFDEEYGLIPHPSPLLETCAIFVLLSTFKLIHNSGARIGQRTLNRAAQGCSGFCRGGRGPYHSWPGEFPRRRGALRVITARMKQWPWSKLGSASTANNSL